MSEWLKEHAWKACVGETLQWDRVALSPPIQRWSEGLHHQTPLRSLAARGRAREGAHPVELGDEGSREAALARGARLHVAQHRLQFAATVRHVAPADNAVAPQERQRVVPQLALRNRGVRLEPVR